MPKGSPQLTEKRKNEILNACEKIYKEQGYYGVTVKEISTQISMTRPAVYNYFETKEEILLGLLVREYGVWCDELERIADIADCLTQIELVQRLAESLKERITLLRILNMNLYELEINSSVERLAEFKVQYKRYHSLFFKLLRAYDGSLCDDDVEMRINTFSAFLFGVFPFTSHTQKQKDAMRIAEVEFKEPGIYEMVYGCLLMLIPKKQ